MAIHLLLAVDGTNSKIWRDARGYNSHVHRFYRDFDGSKDITKTYLDGPKLNGMDMGHIITAGVTWVLKAIQHQRQEGRSVHDIQIDLVGHSRGGLAVVAVANALENLALYEARNGFGNTRQGLLKGLPLSLSVQFMGLYDAVQRAPQVGADTTLANVRHLAHARRLNPPVFRTSRPSFGGMDTRGALYFDTSHGGVGGDPGFFNELTSIGIGLTWSDPYIETWNDLYCNALQLVLPEAEWAKIRPSITNPFALAWIGNEEKSVRIHKIRQYWDASKRADQYVRTEAEKAGVPLLGTTPHVPWNAHDVKQIELGDKLSHVLGITR